VPALLGQVELVPPEPERGRPAGGRQSGSRPGTEDDATLGMLLVVVLVVVLRLLLL